MTSGRSIQAIYLLKVEIAQFRNTTTTTTNTLHSKTLASRQLFSVKTLINHYVHYVPRTKYRTS